jgi:hypothetical protein
MLVHAARRSLDQVPVMTILACSFSDPYFKLAGHFLCYLKLLTESLN